MGSLISNRSLGTKISAVGFSGLILLGNFWILYSVLGNPAPQFITDGLRISAVLTIFGALSLGVEKLFSLWKPHDH